MQKTTPSTTEHDANQLPTATAVTDAVEETVETSKPAGVVPATSPVLASPVLPNPAPTSPAPTSPALANSVLANSVLANSVLANSVSSSAPLAPVKYQPATRRELRALEAAAAAHPAPAAVHPAPAARYARTGAAETAPTHTASPQTAPTRTAATRSSARVAGTRPINTRPASTKPAGTKPARARTAGTPTSGIRRRIISKLATVGAMAGVGLIFISTTVPANAFVRATETQSSISTVLSNGESTQTLAVVIAPAAAVPRDAYTVVSAKQKASAVSSDKVYSYVGNPTGAIQWPFPEGSPISSGFGPRHVANCSACSTFHEGLDFTPGSGTPIHAVADGVVSLVDLGGALGNHVAIDHVINGQVVQSVYAHMQYGSITVAMGQRVVAGQVIGEVGSTGVSTGSHLHLEIHLGGVPVDPYIWLSANAK